MELGYCRRHILILHYSIKKAPIFQGAFLLYLLAFENLVQQYGCTDDDSHNNENAEHTYAHKLQTFNECHKVKL